MSEEVEFDQLIEAIWLGDMSLGARVVHWKGTRRLTFHHAVRRVSLNKGVVSFGSSKVVCALFAGASSDTTPRATEIVGTVRSMLFEKCSSSFGACLGRDWLVRGWDG